MRLALPTPNWGPPSNAWPTGWPPAAMAKWIIWHSHGARRARPQSLVPGTIRIISARLNYWPVAGSAEDNLADPTRAYISRYALGRDYHKVMRKRLQRLADRITTEIGIFGYRVFTDSAPVMEVELGARSGLGWRGKHTLLLTREAGSWFFLGEISIPTCPCPLTRPATITAAPAAAASRSARRRPSSAPTSSMPAAASPISPSSLKGSIPESLRPLIGNRVYGCDDCQLFCPWNKYARTTAEQDFCVRNGLDTRR